MIGNEGMVGSANLLGSFAPVAYCIMQMDGAGYRVGVPDMKRLFDSSSEIRDLVLQSMQHQMLAVSQIAACNRLHNATERLARWLLTASDRIDSNTVHLTQESLSQMLGTRRTTVALGWCAATQWAHPLPTRQRSDCQPRRPDRSGMRLLHHHPQHGSGPVQQSP